MPMGSKPPPEWATRLVKASGPQSCSSSLDEEIAWLIADVWETALREAAKNASTIPNDAGRSAILALIDKGPFP